MKKCFRYYLQKSGLLQWRIFNGISTLSTNCYEWIVIVSDARKGMKFSEEHKRNLAEAHKKRTVYAKGFQWNDDQKEKLKKTDKSYTQTEEYKQKMSKISKEAWAKRKLLSVN